MKLYNLRGLNMVFIVYENPLNIINSVYTDFYERYPKSCVYHLGYRIKTTELEMLQHPPLLSTGWLIICNSSISSKDLKLLDRNTSNVILIQCRSEIDVANAIEASVSVEYHVINNYHVNKRIVIQWIQGQTGCDYDSARYLYSRLGGNMRDIINNVSLLQFAPVFNKQSIKSYTQKSPKANVSDIVPFLLGMPRSGIHLKDVVQVLHKFYFAFPWLINELKKQITDYLLLFESISCGDLNLQNYVEYKDLSKSKRIRSMPLWQLKYIIQLFGQISVEHVYFIKLQLDKITQNRFGVIKLIYLLKIGG